MFAPVVVVWSVCQVEAPLHPSLLLVEACWRLLLLCLLWMVLGGCLHTFKSRLQPGQTQVSSAAPSVSPEISGRFTGVMEPPLRTQQAAVTGNSYNHCSWTSQWRSPGPGIPLALALADSLLLSVLQEPLPDPSVPHIKALRCRLGSVCHTLEKADPGSVEEGGGRGSALTDKVKLIHTYLQQRLRSLRRLDQVQGEFEASVKDVLGGLEALWAQLEELHTGVTLTKEGSRGHKDLASAQTDAQTLFAVLGRYRNRLQRCQAHLKDSTQLLQELTWSHTHIRNSVSSSSSSESVWPELLLQSNIEQFDKVQESFLSLEQQTSTFQAHLEGLGKGDQQRHTGSLAQADGPHPDPVPPQTPPHVHSGHMSPVEDSPSASVPSVGGETDVGGRLSLCERSALQFTSTIGRLRKSGRRK